MGKVEKWYKNLKYKCAKMAKIKAKKTLPNFVIREHFFDTFFVVF